MLTRRRSGVVSLAWEHAVMPSVPVLLNRRPTATPPADGLTRTVDGTELVLG